MAAVREYNEHILAVSGNCDYPDVDAYLTAEGINLHRKCITVNGVAFLGVGGSIPCPGKTPNEFTEDQFKTFLGEASTNLETDVHLILVSHQPPYHTVCDLTGHAGHVGSQSVRDFITQVQPMVCFTGHIHEGRGVDTIANTTVVNSGPLQAGGYGYAEVNPRVEVVEIRG